MKRREIEFCIGIVSVYRISDIERSGLMYGFNVYLLDSLLWIVSLES